MRIQRRVGEHPNIVYMKELVETPARQAPLPRERWCTREALHGSVERGRWFSQEMVQSSDLDGAVEIWRLASRALSMEASMDQAKPAQRLVNHVLPACVVKYTALTTLPLTLTIPITCVGERLARCFFMKTRP